MRALRVDRKRSALVLKGISQCPDHQIKVRLAEGLGMELQVDFVAKNKETL